MAVKKRGYETPKMDKCGEKDCDCKVMPVAYMDADGWVLMGWMCENFHEQDDMTEFEWPFTDDYAKAEDFERLGFVTLP